LAWVLFSWLLTMGINQEVDQNDASVSGTKIQIATVAAKSPAYEMGIREGDTVVKCVSRDVACVEPFANIVDLQAYVTENRGKQITLEILYNRKHHVLKKKDFISCLDIVLLWSHSVNYAEIPFKVQKM